MTTPEQVAARLLERLHKHPGQLTVDRALIDDVRNAAQALADQRATIERLERERDAADRRAGAADRRAGAAERQLAYREDGDRKSRHWMDEAKRAAGHHVNVSFDDVWAEALAAVKALREIKSLYAETTAAGSIARAALSPAPATREEPTTESETAAKGHPS